MILESVTSDDEAMNEVPPVMVFTEYDAAAFVFTA